MKVGATQSPEGESLRQEVLRKELTWQVGGTTGRPACLRRVSRGCGGAGLGAMARGLEVAWKSWMAQSRREMWSDIKFERFL